MTTQQAYIEGFVKRANEYGFSEEAANILLKESGIKAWITEGPNANVPEANLWHKHLERRAYQAAKGMKERIHPPTRGLSGALAKLKRLLGKK
jgi:kynurenine formamidase